MRAAGAGASTTCSFFFLRRFFFDGVAASSVKTFVCEGAGAAAFSRIAASLRSTCARVVAFGTARTPSTRHAATASGGDKRDAATDLGIQRPHQQQQIDRVALTGLALQAVRQEVHF